ncbi:hypothetical protein P7K49_002140 [Saguinus oedipus]|uniref:Uncharacterized protein n=1 Tax=Saguinus oedipus TaxID=9490 RepID=A0ABQ9WGJ2_SAGOE|nr:hypothetical protein P7K49_002140 [Saguinus oedipus]
MAACEREPGGAGLRAQGACAEEQLPEPASRGAESGWGRGFWRAELKGPGWDPVCTPAEFWLLEAGLVPRAGRSGAPRVRAPEALPLALASPGLSSTARSRALGPRARAQRHSNIAPSRPRPRPPAPRPAESGFPPWRCGHILEARPPIVFTAKRQETLQPVLRGQEGDGSPQDREIPGRRPTA